MAMLPIRRIAGTTLLLTTAMLAGCAQNQFTGRRQLLLYSDAEMSQLGANSYDEATGQYPRITRGGQYDMVMRCGRRIVEAVKQDPISDYNWEVRLLQADDVVNAFALPGGKIAVYTGLLKVCQNEDQLAAVMGHEVAHVILQHGNERVSQNVATELGVAGIGALLQGGWSDGSQESKGLIMAAVGLGAQYGVLMPYSRDHESEADMQGLRYMVRAGYDGREAANLWDRMAELGGGGGPEFFSTHPSSNKRARELREMLPRIQQEEAARTGGSTGP